MRNLLRLAVCAGMLAVTMPAASVVYTVTDLQTTNGNNQPLYRYVYNLIGVPLQQNQALEIQFEVSQFAALSNPVAPGTNNNPFSLLLFQPNSPPGAAGVYSLYAVLANPSMLGTFSVDVAFIGGGTPGSQQFFVNQYDSNQEFLSQVTSGFTSASGVPEPSSVVMGLTGLAAVYLARRRMTA